MIKCFHKNFSIESNSWIVLISILFLFQGCISYASKNDIELLNQLESEILYLEKEVKELKVKQIQLSNQRNKILKELQECKKSILIQDTSKTFQSKK